MSDEDNSTDRELSPGSDADYAAIEAAVMETARGRWFLAEYARRNRTADTEVLLAALERIEAKIDGSHMPGEPASFAPGGLAEKIASVRREVAAVRGNSPTPGDSGSSTEVALNDIRRAAECIRDVAWRLKEHGGLIEDVTDLERHASDILAAADGEKTAHAGLRGAAGRPQETVGEVEEPAPATDDMGEPLGAAHKLTEQTGAHPPRAIDFAALSFEEKMALVS